MGQTGGFCLTIGTADPDVRNEILVIPVEPHCDAGPAADGTLPGKPLSILFGDGRFDGKILQQILTLLADDGLDYYIIQAAGKEQPRDDSSAGIAASRAGNMAIFDLVQVNDTSPDNCTWCIFPRRLLDQKLGFLNLHGLVLPAEAASTRFLMHFLFSVTSVTPQLTAEEFAAIGKSMLILLSAAINREMASGSDIGNTEVLRGQILDFINESLANPRLGPLIISERFRVSRTTLYRMFGEFGGIAKLIQRKRLDNVYRILSGGANKPSSISALSEISGFRTPGQFQKSFRDRFGITPKEVVRRAADTKVQSFDGRIHEQSGDPETRSGIKLR
jgi:AraC-like DNA-binding protein